MPAQIDPRDEAKDISAAPERVGRAEPHESSSTLAVYIFRLPEPSRRFAWEIRKLSAIVVERSRQDFATVDDARADGWAALTALTGSARPTSTSPASSAPS